MERRLKDRRDSDILCNIFLWEKRKGMNQEERNEWFAFEMFEFLNV